MTVLICCIVGAITFILGCVVGIACSAEESSNKPCWFCGNLPIKDYSTDKINELFDEKIKKKK